MLLIEANVPLHMLKNYEQINPQFADTDVVLVIGANDIVNPGVEIPNSIISGETVCEVWRAKQVFVIKRGKNCGFLNIQN